MDPPYVVMIFSPEALKVAGRCRFWSCFFGGVFFFAPKNPIGPLKWRGFLNLYSRYSRGPGVLKIGTFEGVRILRVTDFFLETFHRQDLSKT